FPAAAAAVFIHGSLRTAADLETARPCFRSGRLRFLSDRKPAGLDVRGAQGPRHCSLLPAERRRDPRPRRSQARFITSCCRLQMNVLSQQSRKPYSLNANYSVFATNMVILKHLILLRLLVRQPTPPHLEDTLLSPPPSSLPTHHLHHTPCPPHSPPISLPPSPSGFRSLSFSTLCKADCSKA
ncbi:hypothetical protein GBAR_LOCUS29092, partial [Geodia barretti]